MFGNVFDWYSTLWIILECRVGSTRAQITKEPLFWVTLYLVWCHSDEQSEGKQLFTKRTSLSHSVQTSVLPQINPDCCWINNPSSAIKYKERKYQYPDFWANHWPLQNHGHCPHLWPIKDCSSANEISAINFHVLLTVFIFWHLIAEQWPMLEPLFCQFCSVFCIQVSSV